MVRRNVGVLDLATIVHQGAPGEASLKMSTTGASDCGMDCTGNGLGFEVHSEFWEDTRGINPVKRYPMR